MTTSTLVSRRRAAVTAPPIPEEGKPYCSKQRTITATVDDEEKRSLEEINL